MSLLPFFYDVLDDAHPHSIFDQNFGLGILNDDLLTPSILSGPLRRGYIRPWRHLATRDSGVSSIVNDKEKFEVTLDVQQFKPEEVQVKISGNTVTVQGKHEEKQDEHGYISREFTRRYCLPEDVNLDAVASSLSSDGVLTVTAPKKALPAPEQERVISVTQTNAPAKEA